MQKVFRPTTTTFVEQKTLSAKYYTSPKIFEEEKRKIFGDWICAGHVSRIPGKGDYFLFEIFGESIIVARDLTGRVRAFYNVCRHRGTRICNTEDGKGVKHFQCPYHRWTYDTQGNLLGAPDMKDVTGFDKSQNSLNSVPVHIWEGLIFVSLSAKPKPFEKVFGPLLGRFKQWSVGDLVTHKRISYTINANWKLVFLNFSECYHCNSIHPLLNKLADGRSGANDLTEGPFLGGYLNLTKDSMTVSGRLCAPYLGELGEDVKRGYFYTVLPNLLLNIHPDYVMFHIVIPISPNETIVVSEWLFAPTAFGSKDFRPEEAVEAWHTTNMEDWEVCESAQVGISSRGYTPGSYSPRESLLAAFDRHYLRVMTLKPWQSLQPWVSRPFRF